MDDFATDRTAAGARALFYHFDLYTGFRKLSTPGGEAMLQQATVEDWQLTVYEPDFRRPTVCKTARCIRFSRTASAEGKPDKAMPFADRIYRAGQAGEPYFWPNEQHEGYLNMDYYGGDFAGIQQKLPYLRQTWCDLHLPEPHF